MPPALQLEFLLAGSRPAQTVAAELVGFVSEAERSLDVAIYDFEANAGSSAAVGAALEEAVSRGVKVRVAFNEERSPHPASPRPPKGSPQLIDGLEVPTRSVHGDGTLMHHKYVVRDGTSVWTGSMNWTDDAFALEENVILRVDAPAVAAAYARNFEQLWNGRSVEHSGGEAETTRVGRAEIRPVFSPKGPSLAHLAASVLGTARHRIRILSPVMTAGPVLGTLAEFAGRPSFDLVGAYDLTQMEEVQAQWRAVPPNHWKLGAWEVIAPRLVGKRSTPYAPGSVHDYMHAKAGVADDEMLIGSYNLSRHGERNAENVVHVRSADQAFRIGQFAEQVAARYGS